MSWSMKRIKDVTRINCLSLSNNIDSDYMFRYVDIGNVSQNGIIEEPELIKFSESPSRARRIVKKNDVIVSTVRTYLKAIAYFEDDVKDTIVSTGFAVLTSKSNIIPKYLAYKIQSESFIDKIIINSKGVSYPAINSSQINDLEIELTTLKEQTQIANYLDAKTTAIDKKVSLLKQKIKHYKAYRKTLINETITNGLDKTVKLKDSGINWIGEIPEHWEVKRIKDIFSISRGRAIGKTELKDKGLYPVYSSQTKNKGILGYINTYDFNANLLTWTTDGVNAGTVFIREGKFNCTNICGTLIPNRNPKLSLEYMAFAVQVSTKHNKRIDTNGAKIMSNEMAVINIVFPPIEEQIKIASHIKSKTESISKVLKNIETQITTLKELRKTLINEVVTGKVKVSA